MKWGCRKILCAFLVRMTLAVSSHRPQLFHLEFPTLEGVMSSSEATNLSLVLDIWQVRSHIRIIFKSEFFFYPAVNLFLFLSQSGIDANRNYYIFSSPYPQSFSKMPISRLLSVLLRWNIETEGLTSWDDLVFVCSLTSCRGTLFCSNNIVVCACYISHFTLPFLWKCLSFSHLIHFCVPGLIATLSQKCFQRTK